MESYRINWKTECRKNNEEREKVITECNNFEMFKQNTTTNVSTFANSVHKKLQKAAIFKHLEIKRFDYLPLSWDVIIYDALFILNVMTKALLSIKHYKHS